MELFTKIHLLEALEKAKLPHTYKALLNFERKGIIPTAFNRLNTQRLYTKQEIEDIVRKIKEYKEK